MHMIAPYGCLKKWGEKVELNIAIYDTINASESKQEELTIHTVRHSGRAGKLLKSLKRAERVESNCLMTSAHKMRST